MKDWEVTSMTNFMLAGETFIAAGFLLGRAPLHASAASFWSLAMLFLAASMLVGGIDHGFFEQKGDTRDRMIIAMASSIMMAPPNMSSAIGVLPAVFANSSKDSGI